MNLYGHNCKTVKTKIDEDNISSTVGNEIMERELQHFGADNPSPSGASYS
ncbi:MAG: hypothetical protein CM15mV142_110 [Caudoviricetes sp.]|nr:MAG: hypothetical protein CM15mV142_110 [Caudoviricetes sp.]